MAVIGVDVSQYQPRLDWAGLRAQGVRFAIVRLGDGSYLDPAAETHATDALLSLIHISEPTRPY